MGLLSRVKARRGFNQPDLFYAIAVSFDLDQHSVMNQAINHGRSKGIIVIEDCSPVSEGPVGGHDDGTTFIPVGDHLEEELGTLLVHGQIAQFIDNQESG